MTCIGDLQMIMQDINSLAHSLTRLENIGKWFSGKPIHTWPELRKLGSIGRPQRAIHNRHQEEGEVVVSCLPPRPRSMGSEREAIITLKRITMRAII